VAVRLVMGLCRLWYLRGYWTEGRDWMAAILASEPLPDDVRSRAMLLRRAGQLAWLQGDYPAAHTLLEECLVRYRDLGDDEDLPAPLNALGEVARTQGDYARARALFAESLALLREQNDLPNTAWALQALGEVAHEQGDEAALALTEQSLALFKEVGDRRGVSFALSTLGQVALEHGDVQRSQALYEESLAIRRELGYKGGIADSLGRLGEVAACIDDHETAASLFAQSLSLRWELGDRRSIAGSMEQLAGLAIQVGERLLNEGTVADAAGCLERAARSLGAAEALRESLGAPLPPSALARYERRISILRDRLEADWLAAAWLEGRAMPLELVIASALGKDRTASPCGAEWCGQRDGLRSRPGAVPDPQAGEKLPPLSPRPAGRKLPRLPTLVAPARELSFQHG